ncbi:MAG: S8 family serine peptidase [Bacteroidia bacterium]
MKKTLFPLVLIVSILAVSSCQKSEVINAVQEIESPVYLTDPAAGSIIPNKYIVVLQRDVMPLSKFKAEMPYEEKLGLVREMAEEIQNEYTEESIQIEHAFYQVMLGYSAELSSKQVEELKKDRRVLMVVPDRVVSVGKPDKPGKPGKPGGGDGDSDPQQTPYGIGMVNGTSYSGGNVAWILDSGIDLDHPDLNVNVTLSRSFLSGRQSSNPDDQNGHGTHVAGTVAAIDNNIGVVGVAAGATVISVRVLDRKGSGSTSGVINGVDYVAANGSAGDVANMSLTGGAYTLLDDAVKSAAANGIRFCLASGNDGRDANNYSPARANANNVYTVAAMNSSKVWASFSNYSSPPVDYIEPGVNVLSCWKNGGYNTISGTSMATPHLAGVLLLGTVSSGGTVSGPPSSTSYTIGVH